MTGVDAAPTLIRLAREADPQTEHCLANATGLPFGDGQFDLIVDDNSLMDVDDLWTSMDMDDLGGGERGGAGAGARWTGSRLCPPPSCRGRLVRRVQGRRTVHHWRLVPEPVALRRSGRAQRGARRVSDSSLNGPRPTGRPAELPGRVWNTRSVTHAASPAVAQRPRALHAHPRPCLFTTSAVTDLCGQKCETVICI
jgi:hypothetical protein